MPKTTLTLLTVSVLVIISQACAPGAPSTLDPNAINTAIAETLAAAATQTAQPGIPVTGPDTPTATITVSPSPAPPTQTPTALVLPSPIVTATAAAPQISVSVPTNCRVGPGVAYGRVGGLLVGEVAEVVGRHATRDYWIIRNPDRPGETCWLWGEYATMTGNTGVLPVHTPPPTPTPLPTSTPSLIPTLAASFAPSYSGLESCAGTGWWVDLGLWNNGGTTFQSMSLTVTDTATNTVLPLDANNFVNRNGCTETETRPDLPPGGTILVSSPVFTNTLAGHRLVVRITLCSSPGLSGICRTQIMEFTP